ncbi:Gfo/Idh/MocA family oxidoreductase [Candidatus Poribacteria bacterium]|nr:Gfo/Idh/MocA family oxidoreductase [Candidatus Poribacteria bacterium]
MASYRVAILGCGGIAQAHASAYQGRGGVSLVAGAEIDEERRRSFGDRFTIPAMYGDYRELLEREKPDIVSICTWPPLHAEMTVAAAKSGAKAIHCEKPMAVGFGECRAMVDACDRAGVKLVIGHNHRWDANAHRAKELVAEGAIGEVWAVYGYCGDRDLLANGTHVVDQIRFLMDDAPIKTVIGQIDRPSPKIDFGHEVEHGAIGHFYFENGVRAIIEQGTMSPKPYAFHMVGTEGVISMNAYPGRSMQIINRSGEVTVELPSVNPKRMEVDALLAWLEGGPPHPARGENCLETHEVLMAIYASSRLHRAITLPFEGDDFPLLQMIREGLVP